MKNPSITLATVKGNWDEQAGRLKAKFSMLADMNLSYKHHNVTSPEHKAEDITHKTKEELTVIDFSTLSTFLSCSIFLFPPRTRSDNASAHHHYPIIMKNFIFAITAIVTMFFIHQTTTCMAQGVTTTTQEVVVPAAPARFGIKGGLNYSNLDVREAVSSSWLIGFNLGLFAKLPFNNSVALQPELYYTSKGSNVTYKSLFVDGTARFNLNYIEVPLLLVLNPISIVNIHFGPYASYLLNGIVVNTSSTNLFNFESNINGDDFNRVDFGGMVGVGIDLGGLSVGARYQLGLTKVGRERSFLGTTYTFPDARNTVLNAYVSISLN